MTSATYSSLSAATSANVRYVLPDAANVYVTPFSVPSNATWATIDISANGYRVMSRVTPDIVLPEGGYTKDGMLFIPCSGGILRMSATAALEMQISAIHDCHCSWEPPYVAALIVKRDCDYTTVMRHLYVYKYECETCGNTELIYHPGRSVVCEICGAPMSEVSMMMSLFEEEEEPACQPH